MGGDLSQAGQAGQRGLDGPVSRCTGTRAWTATVSALSTSLRAGADPRRTPRRVPCR